MNTRPNNAMHTDSAPTLRLHVGHHWRGAGDGDRSLNNIRSRMHRALPFTLCCLCLAGCVSHTHTAARATYGPITPPSTALPPNRQSPVLEPLFHEDDEALRELVKAAFNLGVGGQPLPERVLRRWEPLETYGDRANLVLVLHRDAREERGLYVVTPYSSFWPPSHDRDWSWEPVRFSEPHGLYSDSVYQYRRTR